MTQSTQDSLRTRPSLLARVKDSCDGESWEEFYALYSDLIYRFARKRGLTESESNDVVQETFAVLARRLPGFEYDPALGTFRGWLLKTAYWEILNAFRNRDRATFPGAMLPDDSRTTEFVNRIPDEKQEPVPDLMDREWYQQVTAVALKRIQGSANARQIQAYDLYVIKEWPATKVAKLLDMNIGQVYLAKHRIGKEIKQHAAAIEREMNEPPARKAWELRRHKEWL